MNPYADYQMAVERQRELEEFARSAHDGEHGALARLAALAGRLLARG